MTKDVYDFVKANVSKETKIFDVVILRDIVFKHILKTGELNMDEQHPLRALDKGSGG